MTIFNLYIFDRNGECLYYGEWNRPKSPQMSMDEEFKLVYGMLYSLKSFVTRISPVTSDFFNSYTTSQYKLSFYETASGVKFVMNTDLGATYINEVLKSLYSKVYVEYSVKNPLVTMGTMIDSELFKSQVDNFITAQQIFR